MLNTEANFPILSAALTPVKWGMGHGPCAREEEKMNRTNPASPEPWLRGTLADVPAVPRAVLHALELAKEDLWK
jgi:hypothetical protein